MSSTDHGPGLPRVTLIIPMLNEAASIRTTLMRLQPLRSQGVEVLVVDGGSRDASVALATPLADAVLESPPGRARQMNLGARQAQAPLLLFLHADTHLPQGHEPRAIDALCQALLHRHWGRFDIRLAGKSRWLPFVAALMNRRSRLSGIATGDQGLFVRRETFFALGGFPDQPLMEDIELSKRLKAYSPPACLPHKVVSSGRRWDQQGAWTTICLMWRLRYRYWRGVSATQLAKEYRDAR
ncbi:TIGR04283 family arsenosugar biosynthesis glycosyltransferase [Halomonas sp. C22]|uniref:TIGR04283 family arsenosugar biosynthesis glycosyltransferase n=1 Tax=Halomonas sp. C22 TaxID=2580567 RepID=UPI0021B462FB|nr:TIGR04283 family arsenosugar biosynthesis glycosyltransferase [Halomonas sp. C22]